MNRVDWHKLSCRGSLTKPQRCDAHHLFSCRSLGLCSTSPTKCLNFFLQRTAPCQLSQLAEALLPRLLASIREDGERSVLLLVLLLCLLDLFLLDAYSLSQYAGAPLEHDRELITNSAPLFLE